MALDVNRTSGNYCFLRRYLKYWARRVGEEAADIPESEEFESAYEKRAQSLFPFRSATTEWTVNAGGGEPIVKNSLILYAGYRAFR